MRQFDATLNLDFARYVDGDSPAHKLHPGTKLLVLLTLLIVSIATRSASALAALFVVANSLLLISRVPFRPHYRTLLRAMPFMVFFTLVQIVMVPTDPWGPRVGHPPFAVYAGQLFGGALSFVRFADLVLCISAIASITRPSELSYATEWIISPLSVVGARPRAFALAVRIALYFVPILGTEATRILKSQVSRGADFSVRGLGIVKRVKTYLPLFVPLLVIGLRHAESLARAMEARCYTAGGRTTRYSDYSFGPRDAVALAGAAAIVAFVVVRPLGAFDEGVRDIFLMM